MRKTLLICLLVTGMAASGQGIIPYHATDENTSTASFPVTLMHGMPFPQDKYVRLTLGTPFFSENWMRGKVLLQEGMISGDLSLRLNLLENTINYQDPQGQEMVITKLARYVVMRDSAGVEYSFLHGDQLTEDKELQNIWFQVLVNSKVSLCKQIRKAIRESKAYGSATVDQSIQTTDIFYIRNIVGFIRIKNWEHLLTVLDDKKELVRPYSKAHRLNGREQNDYVQLLTYYNSLP